MASTRKPAPKRSAPIPRDAIALLKADHKKVSGLFEDFEKTRSSSKKKALVAQICQELTIHATLEEEIFYPAVKAALKDKELVPEAHVEHASVKDLIAQVEGVEPDGEMYDARVKEEQNEMFPKVAKTRLDLIKLRDEMMARKEQLLSA